MRERVRLFGLLIKKEFDTHASARTCMSGSHKGRALFSLSSAIGILRYRVYEHAVSL